MGKNIDISVLGLPELQKKFEALGINMERKIVRKALREGARPVLARAKAAVPVKSGALKRSLKLRAVKRSRGFIGVQVSTGKEGLFKGEQYYGSFVELGTQKAPAQPFLRPALNAHKPETLEIIGAEVRKGVEASSQ